MRALCCNRCMSRRGKREGQVCAKGHSLMGNALHITSHSGALPLHDAGCRSAQMKFIFRGTMPDFHFHGGCCGSVWYSGKIRSP